MIFIGADHRGFELKAKIDKWLAGRGYEFEDLGAYEHDTSDDYVDYAIAVGERISPQSSTHNAQNRGIVICGSGAGADIAANKVIGVRCGLGWEPDQVYAARKDDNINVLALASDNIEEEKALKLVETFLETEFVQSDKYLRRIEKIKRFEGG